MIWLSGAGVVRRRVPALRSASVLAAFALSGAVACSTTFRSQCAEGGCAGAGEGGDAGDGGTAGTRAGTGGQAGKRGSAGGANSGGRAGGGNGGRGGDAVAGLGGLGGGLGGLGGLPGLGGMNSAGEAGSGDGGSGEGGSGEGGSGNSDTFPQHPVLDTFQRDDDTEALGADWRGEDTAYFVRDGQLGCEGFCPPVVWSEEFGVAQEVFATFVDFHASSAEIGLVLKARGTSTCDLMEVFYSPQRQVVEVAGCWNNGWTTFQSFAVVIQTGDQLGGRVRSSGMVEVYRNAELVGSVYAGDYPFIADRGRIGVDGIADGGSADVWDDFGGGSLAE